HDKEGYWTQNGLPLLINEITGSLETGISLISELTDAQALPRIARAIQEIKDVYGRITYKLELDDGNEVEARFSAPILLGAAYLYFGAATNPRPVDPLILAMEEVGAIA